MPSVPTFSSYFLFIYTDYYVNERQTNLVFSVFAIALFKKQKFLFSFGCEKKMFINIFQLGKILHI